MTTRSTLVLSIVTLAIVGGCGDKASPVAAPSASSISSAAPLPAPSDGRKMGSTKQTFEHANGIYKSVFDLKNTASLDAKVEDMRKKLGPPDKTQGDKSVWYAVDADGRCFEFSASATEGAGFTSVDKAQCGL